MDGFWKKKKWMIPSPIGRPMADYPTVAISTLRRVEGVIVRENKEVLERCAIDTFLRGSKYSCPSDSRASSTDSEHMEERSQDEPSEHENPIEVERPFGCDKERVEVGESILSSGRGLQWRGRVLWSLGGRTNYGRALRMFRG
ncbi:hypothetical protein V6N12_064050 [Hibiscus sabdariffa]|uniref:Uncharacterized protein n=1 Tax=Hibiscus sabdariffa TaxID=183260 RepID=A0ABR2AWZ6_9ROSI